MLNTITINDSQSIIKDKLAKDERNAILQDFEIDFGFSLTDLPSLDLPLNEYCEQLPQDKEIIEALCKDRPVEIRGWGKIKTIMRKPKIGRNPKNSKIVPQWLINKIDLRGLAVWYMDDGSNNIFDSNQFENVDEFFLKSTITSITFPLITCTNFA